MKSYLHLLSRIYNTPLLIEKSKFDIISNNVGIKLLRGEAPQTAENLVAEPKDLTVKDIPIVNIFGTLQGKGAIGDSGATSYNLLNNQITSIESSSPKIIGFYIDSPGGEVGGVFALANKIASLKNKGIRTFAITDGSMTSAAYVLGSAVDKIYAVEGSLTGSIAVLMDVINTSKMEENLGIEHLLLTSKKDKVPLNPHKPFTKEGIQKSFDLLMEIDDIVNKTVATNRPVLTIDDIIGMQGDVFLPKTAKELKLIDEIVSTVEDAVFMELDISNSNIQIAGNIDLKSTIGDTMAENTQILELQTKIATLESEIKAFAEKEATAVKAERERCLGILASAEKLSLPKTTALKRIEKGTSLEDSNELFLEVKEVMDAGSSIETTESLTGTVVKEIVGDSTEKGTSSFTKLPILGVSKDELSAELAKLAK